MYAVLDGLPAAHVSENASLLSMGRYKDKGVGGYYWKNESAIGYDAKGLTDKQESESGGKKDPLHGVNRFDKVIRHEVGHAVDKQTGWEKNHAKDDAFGGWTNYGADYGKAFDAMYAASSGGIKNLRKARLADLIGVYKWVMANRAPDKMNEKIMALPWWGKASANTIAQITGDPIYLALQKAMSDPWYTVAEGGVPIGGYIYQQSYTTPQWTRYKAESRSRKVSQYQFRAPGEWFAEAYAAYYHPTKKQGELLAKTDGTAKAWFDKNIDKIAASR
jgi:hypothetical protein